MSDEWVSCALKGCVNGKEVWLSMRVLWWGGVVGV